MKEIVVPRKTILWCKSTLDARHESVRDIEPLRVEASHRCFYRIETNKRTLVLMDSPPKLERNDLFARIGAVFRQRNLPIAEIIAADETNGLFLLTDLGDIHFEALYGTPAQDEALTAAIDLLPQLGGVEDAAIAVYSQQRLLDELDIFSEWFTGRMLNLEIYMGTFQQVGNQLVAAIDAQPKCCVHRDYHCRNLLYNQGKLGVVDFQDALHGPILYDIASLLRDCYYIFDESEVDHWLTYFVSITPALAGQSYADIKQAFDWTAVQRQLKAVGIFARMFLRDGKATHLQYILPVLERLFERVGHYPEIRHIQTQLLGCIEAFKLYLAKQS